MKHADVKAEKESCILLKEKRIVFQELTVD